MSGACIDRELLFAGKSSILLALQALQSNGYIAKHHLVHQALLQESSRQYNRRYLKRQWEQVDGIMQIQPYVPSLDFRYNE